MALIYHLWKCRFIFIDWNLYSSLILTSKHIFVCIANRIDGFTYLHVKITVNRLCKSNGGPEKGFILTFSFPQQEWNCWERLEHLGSEICSALNSKHCISSNPRKCLSGICAIVMHTFYRCLILFGTFSLIWYSFSLSVLMRALLITNPI